MVDRGFSGFSFVKIRLFVCMKDRVEGLVDRLPKRVRRLFVSEEFLIEYKKANEVQVPNWLAATILAPIILLALLYLVRLLRYTF